MTTRIKIIEKNNGEKIYIPQKRGFHKNDYNFKLHCCIIPIIGWLIGLAYLLLWVDIHRGYQCETEALAKKTIDEYIISEDAEYAEYVSRKVKKTSYIKYP